MNVYSSQKISGHKMSGPAIGGVTPFSTVDWPGKLVSTIFVSGCPWRCSYCHNPHLQQRQSQEQWSDVLSFLGTRISLLDGVVLSGGEPLIDPRYNDMISDVRDLGFEVGLHTAGIYPARLINILPQLSWVALDIKTTEQRYERLTDRAGSHEKTYQSLAALLKWGGQFECRTTWSPEWLPEDELLDLAQSLSRQGVREYALQRYRSPNAHISQVSLSADSLSTLKGLFETFSYR